MSPIKVVYLIGELGLGGSERQLYLLLKHFDYSKIACAVIVFNPSQHVVFNTAIEALGVRVIPIPVEKQTIWQRLLFLYQTIKKIQPHVIHSWTVHDNPYAVLVGWLVGASLRWGSMRDSLQSAGFQRLPALFQWLSLKLPQVILVNAWNTERELVNYGLSPHRIKVLPNCASLPEETDIGPDLSQIMKLAGGNPSEVIIGTVGNLRRKKNQLLFVRVMARVIKKYPGTRGVIIGQAVTDEPDMPEQLRKQIKASDCEGLVTWAGFQDQVPALIGQMNIFCLFSEYEGTPNVILEAMAAGRPVVASRVGGIPDLVDHEATGLLVEPGDETGCVEAIFRLLENPELAERLGKTGRQVVKEKYQCARQAEQLVQMYYQAMGKVESKK